MLRFLRQKDFCYPLVIWLIILSWYFTFGVKIFPAPATTLNHWITSQAFWFFNDPPKESDDIAIVAIDKQSRERLGLKWPWKRSVTAQLIQNIAFHSPKVIGLDIVFSGNSGIKEDDALISALKSHPHVVLGDLLQDSGKVGPEQAFVDAAASIGFVNKPREAGVVSSVMPYYIDATGSLEPSIETAILMEYLGVPPSELKINGQSVCLGKKLCLPVFNGKTPLNYLVHYTHFTTVPAFMVLDKEVKPGLFKDKIVLIGATDPIIHDEYATPLGVFPGVTILGNSLVMSLSQRYFHQFSTVHGMGIALFLGLLIIAVNKGLEFLYATAASTFLMGLTWLAFVYLRSEDLVFPYFGILLSGASAYVSFNFHKYANLIYISNHLKNQAIVDPLTGFFTRRFFLLRLQQEAKSREPLAVIGLRIADYPKQRVDLHLDQIKLLIKNLGDYLASEVNAEFKSAFISNISTHTLGVFVVGIHKKPIIAFLKRLFKALHGQQWDVGSKTTPASLQACLLFKPEEQSIDSPDIVSQFEDLFQRGATNKVIIAGLKETDTQQEKNIDPWNISDLLTYDWEERNKELEKSLEKLLDANNRLEKLNFGTLTALARTIDTKSTWTAGHSERVTTLSLELGRALGLSQDELANLHRGGLLHDIGKIATPISILDKPGPLTKHERAVICQHPSQGARILEPIQDFAPARPIVLQHHECFDGTGYPRGLSGENIDFNARILAVADVFDAVTSDRPYRKGMPREKALKIIEEGSGTQFDPRIVEVFMDIIAKKDPKSTKVTVPAISEAMRQKTLTPEDPSPDLAS